MSFSLGYNAIAQSALVSILFFVSHLFSIPSAVTYTFSGGRFGDCLVSYCHAKWIAYKYQLPLLYKSFGYSDQLMMHQAEIHYSDELASQFTEIITVGKGELNIDRDAGILYVIPFFPESIFNREDKEFPYLFTVDWHDQKFKKQLQKMISPLEHFKMIMPQEVLTVAVHIRKGTGWDIPNYRITPDQLTASHPLRFAPDSFYIAQLKRIAVMFSARIIYVYLFTDHNNPGELAQRFAQEIDCARMIIDYRKTENNEFINVLEDFFSLTQFDCLIRADSNFSYIASKLADYKVVISPWHGIVNGLITTIDEINLEINDLSFIVKEKNEC